MNKEVLVRLLRRTIIVLGIYFVIGLVYCSCSLAKKVKLYETGGNNIDENKLDITYNTNYIYEEGSLDSNLTKFLSCYQEPMLKENFTKEMKEKYNEIEKYFASSSEKVSFSYEDIYTGMHISYNENKTYFSASTIKSPVVTYIYKLYTEGLIDLNTLLTYEARHYVEGAGSIRYQSFGKQYTINELIEKTIVDSDNVAYTMLAYYVNSDDIKNYWKKLGADYFWSNGIWCTTTSKDGVTYMKNLYKFTEDNPETKEDLLSYYFKSVGRSIVLDNEDIRIAHKSGWNSAIAHDIAIIYDKQPYVLSIMSLKGNLDYDAYFKKASNLIYEFHTLYWNEKSSYCYNKVFQNN